MRSWFSKRKYTEKFNDNEIKKDDFFSANLHRKKRGKGVQFVVPIILFLTVQRKLLETIRISLT